VYVPEDANEEALVFPYEIMEVGFSQLYDKTNSVLRVVDCNEERG